VVKGENEIEKPGIPSEEVKVTKWLQRRPGPWFT